MVVAAFHCSDETLKKVRHLIEPKVTAKEHALKWAQKWINKKLDSHPIEVDNF